MKEDKYEYNKIPEEFYYEFFSQGSKGKIKKLVRYKLISESPDHIFNLSFGDWNEKTFDADDSITTNNKDRQKVLATVADTVLDFTQLHPEAFIFAQGSTLLAPGFTKWVSPLFGMRSVIYLGKGLTIKLF